MDHTLLILLALGVLSAGLAQLVPPRALAVTLAVAAAVLGGVAFVLLVVR